MSSRHREAFTARDIVRYCAVPGLRDVYILGARERRVTIKSQQVRALNLIWALHQTNRLQRGNVAVIGGGFGGLTAAAAAIRLHANVIVFERETEFASLQDRCDHRRVHPSLFDWPHDDSTNPEAALPVLTWTAGTAGRVREQLLEAWKEFAPRATSCPPTQIRMVNSDGSVQFERNGEPVIERFGNVIIAVGMGLEVDHGSATQSYWRADGLEQYFPKGDRGQPTEIVVIGNGDGGIVDVLRATLGARNPPLLEWIEQVVLPLVPPSLRRELLELERELALIEPKKSSAFLEQRYRDLLLGGLEALQDAVESRKRKDTFVRLVGRSSTPFSPDATALNRFLLALLIRWDPDNSLFKYDLREPVVDERIKVVRRTGTQKGPSGLPKVLDDLLGPEIGKAVMALTRDYDAPRIPQFSPEYFANTSAPTRFVQDIENTTKFYVPLTTSHHKRFQERAHLDAEMRRRGRLGYGHYAFLTERDARAHASWLLGDVAANRYQAVCLALPIVEPIDWQLIAAMPGASPEEKIEHWNAMNTTRVQVCHTDMILHGEASQVHCFYDEQLGAPWPQAGIP